MSAVPACPTTTKLSRITYKQAIIVGLWQVLALIPGTSGSGATIIGGLLCGMSRACASQFTFFLAIPVMAGASGLKLVKFLAGGGVFTVGEVSVLLLGCIVAFVVSILAIRFLMDYVKKHTFTVFGWYRIALGILVLGIWAVRRLCWRKAVLAGGHCPPNSDSLTKIGASVLSEAPIFLLFRERHPYRRAGADLTLQVNAGIVQQGNVA